MISNYSQSQVGILFFDIKYSTSKIKIMNKKQELKIFSLAEITDKNIGKRRKLKREAFENELKLDLLGESKRKVSGRLNN